MGIEQLWIWFKQNISKQGGRKIMGFGQIVDLLWIGGRKKMGVDEV